VRGNLWGLEGEDKPRHYTIVIASEANNLTLLTMTRGKGRVQDPPLRWQCLKEGIPSGLRSTNKMINVVAGFIPASWHFQMTKRSSFGIQAFGFQLSFGF